MKNVLLLAFMVSMLISCNKTQKNKSNNTAIADNTTEQKNMSNQNVYDFTVTDIQGNNFSFKDLKGKKILIVNTASKCGYTPQYEDLEKLYQTYKNQNFTIIGFPANNFGAQEPGSNEEIASFCKLNYRVSFPMMGKISVVGEDMHPLYKFLTRKSLNGVADGEVKWNFYKFLIDEQGTLVTELGSSVKPLDTEITDWITK